jgi:hypothetical protein
MSNEEKKNIIEIQEHVFEIKEQFPSGVYHNLMDLLKKSYDNVESDEEVEESDEEEDNELVDIFSLRRA